MDSVLFGTCTTGEYLGLDFSPSKNAITMRWRVGGHPSPRYSGCNLLFSGLKMMSISPRDEELPKSEDLCVAGISMVTPETNKDAAYRVRRQWNPDDLFHLV